MKLNRKTILAFVIAILTPFMIMAQNTITHSVGRGETIASIAKKYNVPEGDILKLNPEAKEFIYVGLKLQIPQPKSEEDAEEQIVNTNDWKQPMPWNDLTNQSNEQNKADSSQDAKSAKQNVIIGASYFSGFEVFKDGFYMIGMEGINEGWSANIAFGFNFGLADKYTSGSLMMVGPNYCVKENNIAFSISFNLLWFHRMAVYEGGEEVLDSEDYFGFFIAPKLIFNADGKVCPWAGLNGFYLNDSDFEFGWQVGLSIAF